MTTLSPDNLKINNNLLTNRQAYFFLALILVFAAIVRFSYLENIGIGYPYYTAAVDNMLDSPDMLLFNIADAGGVTMDKPPISLWIQVIFASVLGVEGWVVTLPSLLASLLTIILLHHMVAHRFGLIAGLIAALAMAVTPVATMVSRTNNPDSILVLAMLITAWGFLRAVDTGRYRDLLLAAVLMGLAFNVKMLQAYLILPAIYALYFFGATQAWWQKVLRLSLASLVLLSVSFSWVIMLDLIPETERPYIGASVDNSAMNLVFGYNGLVRIFGAEPHLVAPRPDDNIIPSSQPSGEIGSPGIFRIFERELANEFSWLLPLALISILILIANNLQQKQVFPLSKDGQALMLWGGWLITGIVFFSVTEFFHSYYLASLVPALAALVGIASVNLWRLIQERPRFGYSLSLIALFSTVGYQWYIIGYYDLPRNIFSLIMSFCVSIVLVSVGNLVFSEENKQSWQLIAISTFLAGIFIVPGYWTWMTSKNMFDIVRPMAYAGENSIFNPQEFSLNFTRGDLNILDIVTVDENHRYDLVVSSALVGAPITVASDLRVMYIGGFNGDDPIYTVEDFASMIENDVFGFFLSSSHGSQRVINSYVATFCPIVRVLIPPVEYSDSNGNTLTQGGAILYDCSEQ